MEFEFTKEQQEFRQEVREFCQKEPWGELAPEVDPFYSPSFYQRVAEKGWLGISFPKEYGGQGKDTVYETIFLEEMGYSGVPFGGITYGLTVTHCGNLILQCGTERQKKEYLPRIIKGEFRATKMYTEPEAGSDLASVKTTAVRKGDYYLVNGQKMFSTLMEIPYGTLMAITDPSAPPKKGISLFILDKRLPGISYTPIETMTDLTTNQVFLDNVKIPGENLIGEENHGWDYFMQTKPYYWHAGRVSILAGWQVIFDALVKYVRETESNGHPLSQNPAVRQKIVAMAIGLRAIRLLVYRMAWMLSKGLDALDLAAILKILSDEAFLRFSNNAMQIPGLAGQLGGGGTTFAPLPGLSGQPGGASYAPLSGMMEAMYRGVVPSHWVDSGGFSIAKNFLATHGLGLPEF